MYTSMESHSPPVTNGVMELGCNVIVQLGFFLSYSGGLFAFFYTKLPINQLDEYANNTRVQHKINIFLEG